jgi:hypothetical protein
MLYIILFLLLSGVRAESWGIGFGGLTQHATIKKHDYCRKLNDYGTIANRTGFIRYENKNNIWTAMFGEDSICSEIYGVFYGRPFAEYGKRHKFLWLVGAYTNHKSRWLTAKANTPAGFDEVSVFYVNFDGFRVIPVAAIEYDFIIWENEKWRFSINNLLSLFITHHSLFLQRRF